MGDVMVMNEIEATASRLGIDQSQIDLDSIRLPPGESFGIIRMSLDAGVDPDTHKTLGYCFIEYNTPQEAELAKEKTNVTSWTKHIYCCEHVDDFDRFMKVPDEWAPPEFKPYTPGNSLVHYDLALRIKAVIPLDLFDRMHTVLLCTWNIPFVKSSAVALPMKKARDQFVIRAGSDTEVLWNDARHLKPEPVYKRTWSPLGTYLATVHRQGAAVWGEILVTYSSHEPSTRGDANRVIINIFDVRTGKVMRDFRGSADEFAVGGTGSVCWSVLACFQKSLKVENVMDFCWSPTDPILALYVPELGGGNQPARVSLVQIPGKEELRQKNLLVLVIVKCTGKAMETILLLRDIPIEVLELDNKNDKIIAFAWEPKGHRFAVIHGDSPRPDISFYTMRTAHNTGRVSKLTTLKGKQANALFWSPGGRFIVLAGLKGFNGQLEFYNVDELETMATAEHFMATDIDWDPTGRYVATAVTSVHEMENGFNVWSFNGKLLYRTLKDHFFQFLWRPRPPSFLTPEKEEEIAKNLKKYSKKYEAEDQDVSMLLSEQEREKRRMLKDEWEKWVNEWKLLNEEEKLERQELRDGEASDEEEEYEAKDIEVEEVLDVTEEVLPFDD
ncbi:hypothetical protein JRO89_XS03G0240100 [Xanthoceras sorbifolium]|uniref:Eukaryotic translation initiation factor 3 subunit B n=1 Tax=Xanthoceras sorbifolium TaxID=99658 RepID=A0ABQ8IC30_9ROSI|nr:hypothetical protein JRO89_XS03G0240100 [Xanthoceras sorbifolium]